MIVEALRRERDEIELRLAEWRGDPGTAEVQLDLPHRDAAMTDLTGGARTRLSGGPRYSFPVRPQQIVTLRFRTDSSVPEVPALLNWEPACPSGQTRGAEPEAAQSQRSSAAWRSAAIAG